MASNDHPVNLGAEMEIQSLHSRFDPLRERDWSELMLMQQCQIRLLESIVHNVSEAGGKGGGGAELR